MLEFSAFRRSLVPLALCSAAVAASASPASARSHHGAYRYAHAHHAFHHVRRHFAERHYHAHRHDAQAVYRPRVERSVALTRLRRLANTRASVAPQAATGGMSGSSSSLVMEARHYLGTNPTSRASLWCARFMNMVLRRTGHQGTGSDMASSFAHYGHRVTGPEVGAIAVMSRRGGGHVGIITGIDSAGNPIMISGNNGNRVREAPVRRGRIYAYVMPN